jgi:hypothetical protein
MFVFFSKGHDDLVLARHGTCFTTQCQAKFLLHKVIEIFYAWLSSNIFLELPVKSLCQHLIVGSVFQRGTMKDYHQTGGVLLPCFLILETQL